MGPGRLRFCGVRPSSWRSDPCPTRSTGHVPWKPDPRLRAYNAQAIQKLYRRKAAAGAGIFAELVGSVFMLPRVRAADFSGFFLQEERRMDVKQAVMANFQMAEFLTGAYLSDLKDEELFVRPCE